MTSTFLLNHIGLVWVTKSQTGCGDGFCLGYRMTQHSTNVGYVGITCIVTLFEKLCEILVVESAPELNFLMRNGVPKIGVDPV